MLYYRQLNEFMETLEIEILNNNGIIYDNYVCNRLLADHNKQLFIDKQLPMDKFYNMSFDNSTIDRFIKSNKIHIAFINNDDYINFYKFISNSSNIIQELNILLEITISKDEPPYKNNHYVCQGLLLSCQNDEITYYYSNNTGTPYDAFTDNEKLTKKIVKDVLNKSTQYIRGFYSNYEIFTDIYKMINDGWKITNMPYSLSQPPTIINNCCTICLENFNQSNKEIATIYEYNFNKKKSHYNIHHKCLLTYLRKQKNTIVFKCPYRYIIDFNICKYLITFQ